MQKFCDIFIHSEMLQKLKKLPLLNANLCQMSFKNVSSYSFTVICHQSAETENISTDLSFSIEFTYLHCIFLYSLDVYIRDSSVGWN